MDRRLFRGVSAVMFLILMHCKDSYYDGKISSLFCFSRYVKVSFLGLELHFFFEATYGITTEPKTPHYQAFCAAVLRPAFC